MHAYSSVYAEAKSLLKYTMLCLFPQLGIKQSYVMFVYANEERQKFQSAAYVSIM